MNNVISGTAGAETILIYLYLAENNNPVSVIDILSHGIPISKASHGEQWKCRLDFFESVEKLLLVAYSVDRACCSPVYRFDPVSKPSTTCLSTVDSAVVNGIHLIDSFHCNDF